MLQFESLKECMFCAVHGGKRLHICQAFVSAADVLCVFIVSTDFSCACSVPYVYFILYMYGRYIMPQR